jgi:hypothetical protein
MTLQVWAILVTVTCSTAVCDIRAIGHRTEIPLEFAKAVMYQYQNWSTASGRIRQQKNIPEKQRLSLKYPVCSNCTISADLPVWTSWRR